MKNKSSSNPSRRAFLKQMSALSIAGAATPFALNFAAISQASASNAADYKAIVCVFLYGGNDYANTLVPYDATSYTAYQSARSEIAYSQASLTPTVLNPLAPPPLDVNGVAHQYALAPELSPLLPIFNAQKMAVVLNVGPLIQPTTKAQYLAKSVPLPPKLFSHNDQQSVWQSLSAEGAVSGWGGRLGDFILSSNGNSTFTCMNVSGNAVFLSGTNATQYKVSTTGAERMNSVRSPLFGSVACQNALQQLITQPRTHLLEKEHNKITSRALSAYDTLTSSLHSAPTISTAFPNESLASQLKFVAQAIASADQLTVKRQVFFVSLGGFDNHGTLRADHSVLLGKLGNAMRAFYDATVELGVQNQVTTFTASDFGRSLTSNNAGSDHGWGSMHFVLGGAVNGQRFYGKPPVVANNGPDDVGQGRLLPTTSVDQYAATIGKWFGVSDKDLLTIFPNLSNFNPAVRNLGFV